MRAAVTASAAFVLGLTMAGPASATSPFAVELADCDARVAGDPESPDTWFCYFELASRRQRWLETEEALRSRLEAEPADDRMRWILGTIVAYRPGDQAAKELREAADGLSAAGRSEFEARALESLALYQQFVGDREGARQTRERLRRLRERQGRGSDDLRLLLVEAEAALGDGAVAVARERLHAALAGEPRDPELLPWLHRLLGRVAWAEGRLVEARDRFRHVVDLHLNRGDDWAASAALYDLAVTQGRLISADGSPIAGVLETLDRLFDLASRSGNLSAEAKGRTLLAQMPDLDIDRRVREADHALRVLRQIGGTADVGFALRLAALVRQFRKAHGDLRQAEVLIEQALEQARAAGSLDDEARAWQIRANLAASRDSPIFRESYARAIDVVERIRDLRSDRLVRGRYLWDWAHLYQRLVGAWLEAGKTAPGTYEIDQALRVMERLRSRITLDTMDAAGATRIISDAASGSGPEFERREVVLAGIAAVQRELLLPGTATDERRDARTRLTRLEFEEAALRESIARGDRSFARLRRFETAGLDDIRELLRPDEALLLFQVSTREVDNRRKWYWNGGSWLVLVTSEGVRAEPLADSDVIERLVSLHLGLIRRDDPAESLSAQRLYDELLAPALDPLPTSLRRLIIVPDGVLHRLPFATLRIDASADPLGATLTFESAPSATAWVLWRRTPMPPGTGLLSLAGPAPMAMPPRLPEMSGSPAVGSLPHARAEAGAVVRRLQTPSRVYTGTRATESMLAQALERRATVLHLATHAVVDREDPARTALLLSAADRHHDGLLQLREIVSLPLHDRLVILSSCSGAEGELSHGEGMIGLARGFFQAGARAVVAGLWPVADEQARRSIEELAGRLAEGRTVAEALAGVRQDAIADGLPPSAWAGWILLGDGDVRLDPRKSSHGRTHSQAIGPAVLLGLLVLLAVVLRASQG